MQSPSRAKVPASGASFRLPQVIAARNARAIEIPANTYRERRTKLVIITLGETYKRSTQNFAFS